VAGNWWDGSTSVNGEWNDAKSRQSRFWSRVAGVYVVSLGGNNLLPLMSHFNHVGVRADHGTLTLPQCGTINCFVAGRLPR